MASGTKPINKLSEIIFGVENVPCAYKFVKKVEFHLNFPPLSFSPFLSLFLTVVENDTQNQTLWKKFFTQKRQ